MRRRSRRPNKFKLIWTITTLLLLVGAATPVDAVVKIDITAGKVDPLPVAITRFVGADADTATIGAGMTEVIGANLTRSGLFAPIDPSAFIQKPEDMLVRPRFADWRLIEAQALVTGGVELKSDGKLHVQFRLWDVFAEQQMAGFVYTSTPSNWRRIAHIVSDAIYKRITGEEGYFDTRIVYVSESGARDRRIKRLAIMDQDGHTHRFLTDGGYLVLTPRFSPKRQEITYLSYFRNKPRVYILDIDSGRQEVLGDFTGMTFAPRFSPDGEHVIMTFSDRGNSDIYKMDLRSRLIERLTDHPAIDTSPSYAPDGSRITFNSDRGGTQQLYVMEADGDNVRRISFGPGRYMTPVWSPRGDYIAFTKQRRGKFSIGVMRPDGTGERRITKGSFLDEGPTWAPNGRVLMFFRQTPSDDQGRGGVTRLWSIDLTGFNERPMITPTDASDPAWSPLALIR